ncbi:GntR family transcriptional regulator [Methyloligella sp. 2.7D]|uniref:GntR family transcriptional regulator n=1 Tax=unclassified Methyloligella TaxID=2625955 RepID=UPI00157DC6B7|nr:GntR family transcriptional regulator [Methyloligella sp. GL2]QKP77153.1 GntR family transcriptional regulator [Methyloligella sp. GL2]
MAKSTESSKGPDAPSRRKTAPERKQNVLEAGAERAMTSAQRVRAGLEEDILFGRIKPGERIDEVSVSHQYNVSRTPVREALNSLASGGLVDVRPRQGVFVAEFTIEKLIEMFEVMAGLEGFCVRLAARRATPEEIEAIIKCNEEVNALAREGNSMGFFEKNNELHGLFYRASGNETLIEMTLATQRKVAPYRRYATYHKERMQNSIGEHQAVIDAIMAHDEDAADRLMREHLSLLAVGFSDLVAALAKDKG